MLVSMPGRHGPIRDKQDKKGKSMKLNTMVMCAATLFSAIAYGAENGSKKEFDPASLNKVCGIEFGIAEAKGVGVDKQVKLEKSFRYVTAANCIYKDGFLYEVQFEGPMPKDWTANAWDKEVKDCMDVICKKFNIPMSTRQPVASATLVA